MRERKTEFEIYGNVRIIDVDMVLYPCEWLWVWVNEHSRRVARKRNNGDERKKNMGVKAMRKSDR